MYLKMINIFSLWPWQLAVQLRSNLGDILNRCLGPNSRRLK